MAQPYEIVSVRQAKRPPGGKGSNWYRYVIAFEGTNTIHGHRQGGIKAVTRAVEEIVAKLNERHRMTRGIFGAAPSSADYRRYNRLSKRK